LEENFQCQEYDLYDLQKVSHFWTIFRKIYNIYSSAIFTSFVVLAH